jgi:hypothetical protein
MSKTIEEVIITDQGFVRRVITENVIAGADDAIAKALSRSPQLIPFISCNSFNGALHLRVCDGYCVVASELPRINLEALFMPKAEEGGPGFLTPDFNKSPNSVGLKVEWTPSEFMRIWFVTMEPEVFDRSVDMQCFLLFNRTDRPGIFRLPLPNTYGDGKICTGNDQLCWSRNYRSGDLGEKSRIGLHHGSLSRFMETAWNSDLSSDVEHTSAMFQFDFNGKQRSWPSESEVDKHCEIISHTHLNWLALAKGFSK